ncbi:MULTISPECIES: flagellar biosynthesis protein FlhB [Pseudovibrio]|uniref:flagellar biosynthesis protein FlhB n=1 Tax=Stappiaceae TaxID=2821832 RepID=UPI0023666FBA|nr:MULTISPECIES: flagellar biosynthesis protein FlhB [Pseudovibrio]MDD7910452.1 flagellar biosynthesis protein FlhB [Pseudovibrio exalbescens]MDX5594167.1 flagellar biosynthesis protein FlhB [Pseudovibrio sp. SPO723]
MADETDDSEKTEDPSQKRLTEAHEKGDVPKSQEVNGWFALLGTAMVVAFFAQPTAAGIADILKGFFEHADSIPVDGGGLLFLLQDTGPHILVVLALPLLVMMVLAVVGNVVQHKPVFTAESIQPKLNKVSPLAGAKRLFSKDSLMNFAKGLMKIAVVSTLIYFIVWPQKDQLETAIFRGAGHILQESRDLSLQLVGAILALMTVVAGLDFAWQRQKWFNKQKMTQREVKEEYKQSEGDPQIKAKIRQLRAQRSQQRMMAEVPKATVVVTNPTHYAVALFYDDEMQAPKCVAKGVDALALRIRELAEESSVPIVENPPLARALHATMEINDMIPEEHYAAVAKVIGYVMQLREKKNWRS